jgi:hypothetical protein
MDVADLVLADLNRTLQGIRRGLRHSPPHLPAGQDT